MIERPGNREELFNLRHAMARNCVERIFGVVKKRWAILTHPAEFDMDIQARIPAGLAALHNFIFDNDDLDLDDYTGIMDPMPGFRNDAEEASGHIGILAEGPASNTEKRQAKRLRDDIAERMWVDYQNVLTERQANGELVD